MILPSGFEETLILFLVCFICSHHRLLAGSSMLGRVQHTHHHLARPPGFCPMGGVLAWRGNCSGQGLNRKLIKFPPTHSHHRCGYSGRGDGALRPGRFPFGCYVFFFRRLASSTFFGRKLRFDIAARWQLLLFATRFKTSFRRVNFSTVCVNVPVCVCVCPATYKPVGGGNRKILLLKHT